MKKYFPLITTIDGLLDRVVKFYRNRWIRLSIQIFVLVICGIFVYRHSSEIINVAHQLRINVDRILFSWFVLSLIYLFIGTTSWWCILKGLGESPGWIRSANIQLVSTLAKYVPGYIWQYVGKAVMSKDVGITSLISGTAMAFELGQTLLIGIGIAFVSYSAQAGLEIVGLENIHKVAFPLGMLIILASYGIAWFFPFLMPQVVKTKPLQPKFLFTSVLLITLSWCMLSFSFWLLGTSITPIITVQTLRVFILATSVSMVAGIIIIFVPNGLGIREGVMVLVLGTTLGIPLAIVFAAMTRLVVTVCELTSAFLMGLVYRHHSKPPG